MCWPMVQTPALASVGGKLFLNISMCTEEDEVNQPPAPHQRELLWFATFLSVKGKKICHPRPNVKIEGWWLDLQGLQQLPSGSGSPAAILSAAQWGSFPAGKDGYFGRKRDLGCLLVGFFVGLFVAFVVVLYLVWFVCFFKNKI